MVKRSPMNKKEKRMKQISHKLKNNLLKRQKSMKLSIERKIHNNSTSWTEKK
jgi:hypothetical protein